MHIPEKNMACIIRWLCHACDAHFSESVLVSLQTFEEDDEIEKGIVKPLAKADAAPHP